MSEDETANEQAAAQAELEERLAASERRIAELEARYERARRLALAMGETADRLDELLKRFRKLFHAALASRRWRIGHAVVQLLRIFSRPAVPGLVREFGALKEEAESWRRQYRAEVAPRLEELLDEPPLEPLAAAARSGAARGEAGQGARTRVSVLAWDVGHNPFARAHLLAEILSRRYDVELVGAQFPRYGTRVWEPLREEGLPVVSFPGREFPEHLDEMRRQAERLRGDLLFVCKPRLPSLELGILAKLGRNRPLVVDVDDFELAFFDAEEGLDLEDLEARRGDPDLRLPFGETWTRVGERLAALADGTVVSSGVLAARYGGVVVPHARDERVFDPALYDRERIRQELGLRPGDRVVVFVGTSRPHKGLGRVLEALQRIGKPEYRLCVVGQLFDPALREAQAAGDPHLIALPDRPFSQLAPTILAGDLVCLLSDPGHAVSRFQTPAKFTDALAMGVPVLATAVGPLADLAERGLVVAAEPEGLDEQLDRLLGGAEEQRAGALARRSVFLEEFSYAANLERLATLFAALPAGMPAQFERLIELQESLFAANATGATVSGSAAGRQGSDA